MALIGADKVLANLSREIAKIENKTKAGLMAAGVLIKGESMKRTPVLTGALKNSHYLQAGQIGDAAVVEVGVTQEYGINVHENLENHHPTGEAKYLENAIKQNQLPIMAEITKRIKI